MDLPRRTAAALGAAHGVAGAAVFLALAAAARAAGIRHWAAAVPQLLLDGETFGVPVPGVLAVSLAAAGIAGAAVGALARRLSGSASRRVAVLLLISLPVLYGVIALSLMTLFAPDAARRGLRSLAALPFGCMLSAGVGTVLVAPTALLPTLAAALLLEGWTRPPTLPQGGLADATVRRWVLHVVLMLTAALLSFAYFH